MNLPEGISIDENPPIAYPWMLIELIDGRYERGLELLESGPSEVYDWQQFYYPKSLLRGQIYRLMGRSEMARRSFEEARQTLEAYLQERFGDSRVHSALGLAYAGLGMTEDAIKEGLRGVDLLPYQKDKFAGPFRLRDLAQIYAIVGENDLALENLEILVSLKSLIDLPEILGDPTWIDLRDDERFQALGG